MIAHSLDVSGGYPFGGFLEAAVWDRRSPLAVSAAGVLVADDVLEEDLSWLHDAQPELGAFGVLDPQAENVLGAVRLDAEGDVDCLVADHALISILTRMASKKTSG